MRNMIFLFLLFNFLPEGAAQYPVAAGSPYGNFIFLDNRIPGDMHIEVYRSENHKNEYNKIATTEAPSSEKELADRIRYYEKIFHDFEEYDDQEIKRMWNFISVYPVIDTLPPVNYPVMHLAAGTAYLDTSAKKGVAYKYMVKYLEGQSNDTRYTDDVIYPPDQEMPIPVFNNENKGHHNIYADWYVEPDPVLYSFIVYRRQNLAGNFEVVHTERGFYNRGDSLFLVVNDRNIRPRSVYEYYIVTLDRLANRGEASRVHLTNSFTRSDLPVVESFDVSPAEEDHRVKLAWQYSNRDMVRSISIYRSDNYDSAYVKIAEVPAGDTIYIDPVPIAMENFYYYLVLEGIMNRGYPGAIVGGHSNSKTPPDPPSEINAEPVEGGILLHWTHLDPVVHGYYIYRDQGENNSLSQISGFIPSGGEVMSWRDSSKTLRGNFSYRYAVRAVNDGYEMSRLSDTVSARPLLPTNVYPPSDIRGGLLNGQVILVWENMYRTNEFLLGYNVHRRSGEGEYKSINEKLLLFNENTYTDSFPEEGNLNTYAITAIDESGSESVLSSPLSVYVPGTKKNIPPPYGLKISKSRNGFVLSWPANPDNENEVRIYRRTAGKEAEYLSGTGPEEFNFTDTTVEKGELYFYYIRYITPGGEESLPSEEVGMRY